MNFNFFKRKNAKEIKTEKTIVTTRYSYEWNNDVPIEQRDSNEHPSRPFCKKMIELNRFYTREDIEKISERLGYSVWDRKGGDDCRHRWFNQIVVKKVEE